MATILGITLSLKINIFLVFYQIMLKILSKIFKIQQNLWAIFPEKKKYIFKCFLLFFSPTEFFKFERQTFRINLS